MRDKRRARRDRIRRSAAEHALEVWAAWAWDRREYGWPHESSEVRAYLMAQTKTETQGEAAYRGRIEVEDEDGKIRLVPKEPPPMPKDTRVSARPRVPEVDRARLGPQIDRLLRDMDEVGLLQAARVVRASALFPQDSVETLAGALGMTPRHFLRLKRRGLVHLEVVLSYEPVR